MYLTETVHHNVYTLENNERELPENAGDCLELRSVVRKLLSGPTRSWYLQGDFGSLHFRTLNGDAALKACEETLAKFGYKQQGTLPPECFEYRR